MRWVAKASPRYEPPLHLAPLCALIDRIRAGETVKAVVHAPPRHWKTETVLHAPTFLMEADPSFVTGYVTYEQGLAEDKSHIARQIAQESGILLERSKLGGWMNRERGGLIATSIEGPFTGKGVRLLIVDDYFKGRADAESAKMRRRQWEWWTSVALLRLEPGASVIVLGTRWHPEDLGGRLLELGWPYLRLPALAHPNAWQLLDSDAGVAALEGAALLQRYWPAAAFAAKKRDGLGEYDWISLFQGLPRARGGNVFGDPTTYERLPERGRLGIGIDLAYSKKKASDWNCAVVMLQVEEPDRSHRYYVLGVLRLQCKAHEFKRHLRALHVRYPTARIRFYGASIEQEIADLMARDDEATGKGVPIDFRATQDDKFVRAQPVAGAWNNQRVLVPQATTWLNQYVTELVNFTGVGDDHDDQVDATAAAYDVLKDGGPGLTEWGDRARAQRRM